MGIANDNTDVTGFRQLVESHEDLIVRVNSKGEYLYVNPAFCNLTGKSPDELMRSSFHQFIHPDDLPAAREHAEKLFTLPARLKVDMRQMTIRGYRWIRWDNISVFDEKDDFVEIRSFGRDITDEKTTQEHLHRTQTLLEYIALGTQSLLVNDDYQQAITEALRMLGTAANVDRTYIFDIYYSESAGTNVATQRFEWTKANIEAQIDNPELVESPIEEMGVYHSHFLQNKSFYGLVKNIEGDPVLKEVLEMQGIISIILIPIFVNNALWGFIGFDDCTNEREWLEIDIHFLKTAANALGSKLKKMELEKQVRTAELRYKFALEATGIGLWDLEIPTNKLYLSPEWKKMIGYQDHEIKNEIDHFVKLLHPDDVRIPLDTLRRHLDGELEYYRCEYRLISKTGEPVWVLDQGRVIERTADGIPFRMIGTHTDITEERAQTEIIKQNEAKLRSLLTSLPDNIFIFSADGVYLELYANQPGLLVADQSSIIGKSLGDFFPQDQVDAFMDKFVEAKEKKDVVSFYYSVHIDELEFVFEARIYAISDDKILAIIRDDTERARAQNKLLESQANLEEAQRIAQFGYWNVDLNTGRTFFSNKMFELLGYDANEVEPSVDVIMQIIHPGDKKLLQTILTEVSTTGTQHEVTLRLMLPNGTITYVEVQINKESRNGSEMPVLHGTMLDITRRRLAEIALENSERKYRKYIDQSPIAVFIIKGNGSILHANKAACSLTGFTYDDLSHMLISDLIPDESKAVHTRHFLDVLRLGTKADEMLIQGKFGSKTEVNMVASLLDDDEVITYCVDMSKIKEMIKQLAENQERFDNYFTAINDLIYFYDFKTKRSSFANDFYEKVIGMDPKLIIDHNDYWINHVVHPDDREGFNTFSGKTFQHKKASFQYRIIDKNGAVRWLWDRNWVVHDQQGNPIRVEGIATDITESKNIEMATQQALIKEKELNELKSRFISTTSHEFRTPLTSIFSSAELLEHYGHKWDDEKRNYYYKKIQRVVTQLKGLLDDILLIDKVESGKLQFNPQPIRLKSFVSDIIEEFSLYKSDIFTLEFIYDCPREYYRLDEKLSGQIFRNLISNAFKYSPSGGHIRLSVTESDNILIIEVSDQGIGISPEDIQRLFTRFFRGNNTAGIEGTGLGLPIMKNAVQFHGGIINVQSELQKGTTFTITIPVTE
ncbi:MAG: PAS domain S-box protein [Ignavibacteriales bacterium]|nr:MAG: PAS domain S-box protein [Ignavibacteriales bacterium]